MARQNYCTRTAASTRVLIWPGMVGLVSSQSIGTTVPGPRSGGPGVLGPIQSCHVSLWPPQAKLQGYDYSLHVACNAARDKAASLGVDRAKLNKQVRCPAASPAALPPAPHGIPCSRLFTFAI